MNYNKKIDAENIKIYAKFGLKLSHIERHRCVICGDAVSIDRSMSNKGKRLICNSCSREKFKSLFEAMEWVNSEE